MIEIARILCPVDFSECSRRALQHALATARWYGSRVTVLYVPPYFPAIDVIPSLTVEPAQQLERVAGDHRRAEDMINALIAEAGPGTVPVDRIVAEAPAVHREVLDQARALGADLIVLGSHGRSGFDRLVLGSVAEKVLRKATCPVMVVPPHAEHPVAPGDVHFDRILCAVDFSSASLAALEYALSMAEEASARLTLATVIEKPPELDLPEVAPDINLDAVHAAAEAERLRRLRALIPESVQTYCTVETAVSEGRASRAILRLAAERQSDLIVMGVNGRGAIDLALFGSNTREVIAGARCPLLTVRPRDDWN
jgi:nucleotide-binding universal stress UspA family protein